MNAKAWNARVICRWLSDVLASAAEGYDIGYDEGRLTLVCHSLKLVCQLLIFFLFNTIRFTEFPLLRFKGIASNPVIVLLDILQSAA